MAETQNILQDGVERFREAFGSIEDEVERVQRDLRSRRKKLEKRFESGRKDLEKRLETQRKDFEKRTKKLRTRIEKNPAVKRFDKARKDATKQWEQGVSELLSTFQIATKSDLQKVDRKISQLTKKLREMDGPKRTNGKA